MSVDERDSERLIYVAKYAHRIEYYVLGETGDRSGVSIFPVSDNPAWEGHGPDLMSAFRMACDKIIEFENSAVSIRRMERDRRFER